jgi:hypothetical protein
MASNVELTIRANTKEAESAIAAFAQKANQGLDGLTGAFTALKAVAGAAVAYFAGRQVIGAIESMTTAASESEAAITKMQVALKLSGSYTDGAAAAFERFASSIQATTQFSDEAVLSAVSLAKSFNVSNDAAQKMVKAAVDLSSEMGVGLNEAVSHLGKTLDGTAGRVGETIPQIRNLTEEQLKAGAAIDIIGARYKGLAAALGNTFSGQITRTKNAFDDLLEVFGGLITKNPLILSAIGTLRDGIGAVAKFIEKNESTIRRFINQGLVGIASAIGPILRAFSYLVRALGVVKFGVDAVLEGVLRVVAAFLNFTPIQAVVVGLVKVLGLAAAGLIEIVQELAQIPGVGTALKAMGIDSDALNKKMTDLQDTVFKFVDEFDGDKLKGATDAVQAALKNVNDTQEKAYRLGADGLEHMADAATNLAKKLGDVATNAKKAGEASAAMKNGPEIKAGLTGNALGSFLQSSSKNPAEAFFQYFKNKNAANPENRVTGTQLALGAGIGGITSVLGGAAGAQKLISGAASAAANAILPGAGQVVGPIIDALSQGPEKVKAMVTEFVDALPTLLQNVIEAIPALIDTLAAKLPDLVDKVVTALANSMPRVATHLAAQAPFIGLQIAVGVIKHIPDMVSAFAKEFMKIPAQFLHELIDGLKNAVGSIIPGLGGGGAGDFIKGALYSNPVTAPFVAVGDFLGLRVDPREQTSLSNARTASDTGAPRQLVIKLQLGERELAESILQLTQAGFRLA